MASKVINKKASIKKYVSQFNVKFEMDDKAIDLRKMGENYKHNMIPLGDISQAIQIVKPELIPVPPSYDPSIGFQSSTTNQNPKLMYVPISALYLCPTFQRDVSPNHFKKIFVDYVSSCVVVPNAIKFIIDNKEYYCLWDGHHTAQVCILKGWTTIPINCIDVELIPDEDIIKERKDPVTERNEYGKLIAGQNMIRINKDNKRKLDEYDEFKIRLETHNVEVQNVYDIMVKNKCEPKRSGKKAGDLTQIKVAMDLYNLSDLNGTKGIFFDRALKFHRTAWPRSPIELEIMRPMALLYQRAALQAGLPNMKFDDVLMKLLKKEWGSPKECQQQIKESFRNANCGNANNEQLGTGAAPSSDPEKVFCGLVNFYNQNAKGNKVTLPAPEYTWTVV